MTQHQVRCETFLLQRAQHRGDGGATGDPIGVGPGKRYVCARVPRVERIGTDRYDARPVMASRNQREKFVPALLLQRRCDVEELPGKVLVQEQHAHASPPPMPARCDRYGLSQTILVTASADRTRADARAS